MKLEHFGMAEPGDCRLVFTAEAEGAGRALSRPSRLRRTPRRTRKNLLTAAVNRTILEGF